MIETLIETRKAAKAGFTAEAFEFTAGEWLKQDADVAVRASNGGSAYDARVDGSTADAAIDVEGLDVERSGKWDAIQIVQIGCGKLGYGRELLSKRGAFPLRLDFFDGDCSLLGERQVESLASQSEREVSSLFLFFDCIGYLLLFLLLRLIIIPVVAFERVPAVSASSEMLKQDAKREEDLTIRNDSNVPSFCMSRYKGDCLPGINPEKNVDQYMRRVPMLIFTFDRGCWK